MTAINGVISIGIIGFLGYFVSQRPIFIPLLVIGTVIVFLFTDDK